jgi:hypothetical protein
MVELWRIGPGLWARERPGPRRTPALVRYVALTFRTCLTAHEGNHIISEAMTTIAR